MKKKTPINVIAAAEGSIVVNYIHIFGLEYRLLHELNK